MKQKVMYFLSILLIYFVLYLIEYGIFSFIFVIFPVSSYIFLAIMLFLIVLVNPLITYIIGEILIDNKFI